ncbi:hypothetical protein I79_014890 [Cricetulus griseus]|uniref:Uncharacterized protein n=1 Tax=Cricetulus griseus TaxID=10029 RepID=G3HVA9_CRIGR|nr:hypothetical protein I79_014890 [Cricetulus griseus]
MPACSPQVMLRALPSSCSYCGPAGFNRGLTLKFTVSESGIRASTAGSIASGSSVPSLQRPEHI